MANFREQESREEEGNLAGGSLLGLEPHKLTLHVGRRVCIGV